MRIYDVRLGRFLSVDPITDEYPELTPYQFASNTPIQAIDLDGLEQYHYSFTLDAQGSPVLTPMYDGKAQDFTEYTPDWGFGGGFFGIFHTVKATKNPRVEYVIHHEDSKRMDVALLERATITYDETITRKTYLGILDGVTGVELKDFDNTPMDAKVNNDVRNGYIDDVAWKMAGAKYAQTKQVKTSTGNATNKQATAANGGNTKAAESNTATPEINTQQQTGHVPGTPQYKNRIKQGKPTSAFYGQKPGEMATKIAWKKGKTIQVDKAGAVTKEYDFGVSIGTGKNGGTQTKVKVKSNANKTKMHGHPSGKEKL